MATREYYDLLDRINRLSRSERLRLLKALAISLEEGPEERPRPNLMDLEGLGKELWSDVDVDTYIDKERASWNG